MDSAKEVYAITIKCKLCPFQVTHEVEIEPAELSKTKAEMVKMAGSIHKAHPDPANFVVF